MTRQQARRDSELIEHLFEIIREESYRDPLFDAVQAGTLPREGLKIWILQVAAVVRQFTRFVSGIHANCPFRDAQALLAESLWEEHGRGNTESDHLSLALRLARGLGATEEEIESAEIFPETREYIEHCLAVTHDGSFIAGITTIGLGIERSIPVFYGGLANAMQRHYGLTARDVAFLTVHVHEDANHASRSLAVIEKYGSDTDSQQQAVDALREILRVKRRFSETLYQRIAPANPDRYFVS
jgi:pyrroloquinoline quinone (PQQ) biosynthesis protein C